MSRASLSMLLYWVSVLVGLLLMNAIGCSIALFGALSLETPCHSLFAEDLLLE